MMKMKWPAVLCMVICVGVAQAQAQTQWEDRGFATVSIGVQPTSQDFTELSTPVIYGENASISVPHTISSGLLFDIGGVVRVWKNLGVGLSYSHFSDSDAPTVAAQIPNPLLIGQPRSASASAGDLSHSENGVHILIAWMFPLTDKFRVAAMAGPSFINVSQDLVTGITAQESAPPYTTVTINSVSTESTSGTAKGVNAGIDATYQVTTSVDLGVFGRFAGGSVDLEPSTGNTISIDAGGFQLGAGLRYRF